MGTKASPDDEWIELYNPNSEPVEILDWKMLFYPSVSAEPRITTFAPILDVATPTVDAFGYFLLERTDDTTISDIEADYVFKLQYGLNDDGGILELRDKNSNLIDRVDCSEGWCAGDKENRASMERYGDAWVSNNLLVYNGKDAGENDVFGTPKAGNSNKPNIELFTALLFEKFDEFILYNYSSPYILKTELIIPEGKTLKINPGAAVKFYDEHARITVNGTLKAIGTENEKIIFTSLKDYEYGEENSPLPGLGGQIYFSETSIDSELNNIILRCLGNVPAMSSCHQDMAGIRVENSSIILKDSTIEKNKRRGVYLINSSSLIDNVQFLNNRTCTNETGAYGIEVSGGDPAIRNSLFKGNRVGISINKGTDIACPVIENNTFEENQIAIQVSESAPYFNGNQAVNNDINGVVIGNHVEKDTIWQSDLTYVIRDNIAVLQDVVLTLEPGVVVKFYNQYSKMIIAGTLKVNNVVFTSFKDDEYGGDTNNDNDATSPREGNWGYVYFTETSIDSELNNIILRYGGDIPSSSSQCDPNMAGIRVENSSIILKDSIIEHNQYKGLGLINSSSIIDNVQFSDNPICYNRYGGAGISANEGDNSIISNSLFKKHKYGLYINSENTVLENLSFGTGEEANECNIYKINQCINPISIP